ncbi:DNA-3-methyladenine glycosylase 2 family protein [Actinocrinis sp.]|uniref:DNA-3-methyladenine glycosylase family protein n=1 Tax=Actinocrinis sp. TaxID=1920516 RepID=UPI002D2FF8D2|nr:DNA-3-methyladenine glycosylase 2 family protein [Actinocrinis sp.]HZP50956.1 DNA-3-methyladenine glycosylase 2 family protein [Actinocrinis sp.]
MSPETDEEHRQSLAVPQPRQEPPDPRALPDAVATVHCDVDLPLSLGVLRRGPGDPTYRMAPDGAIWRACLTPHGPGSIRLRRNGEHVEIAAWGEGAHWLVDRGPAMIGADDHLGEFANLVAGHPLLAEAHRRLRRLRLVRTGLVVQSLIPAILEQRVTTKEAFRAWRRIVERHGSPAPGPAPQELRVPPPPEAWARIPSWEWHRHGVDVHRSSTIMRAVRVANGLERTGTMSGEEAVRRLCTIPGIGIWTAAETTQRSHGHADALSVGDLHLSKHIGYALTGERDADDARMIELLEPFRPHRYRAARLILLTGPGQPRHTPRARIQDHRWH